MAVNDLSWRQRLAFVVSVSLFVALGMVEPVEANGGFELPAGDEADEMFFYRDDGLFAFYRGGSNGKLGNKISSGDSYTNDWSSIESLDLEGDGTDEMLFYRDDGLYAFYDVRSNATLGTKFASGTDYTKGWSSIVALDLEGDGTDEIFFYRDDGLFAFYDVRSNASLGSKISSGTSYTKGWSQITALDIDGDGSDEMLFYRDDGLFAFYDVRSNATLGTKFGSGTGYTKGWSQITELDMEGDGTDEIFFYRDDGLYAFYDVRSNATLGTKYASGTGYTKEWSAIASLNLDATPEPFSFRDGIYRVGVDIPSGTYRQASAQPGCYWERLSGFSGSLSDILANEFTFYREIVTIDSNDVGFASAGCGTWTTLIDPISRSTRADFPDGTYLVNYELAPGNWANSNSSQGCYWERLTGFSGEFGEIIANDFTTSPTIVTISSGDTGFTSDDCGIWTYLGS